MYAAAKSAAVARHEVNQSQKETDDRLAEIDRELKRRAAPAE